MALIIRHATIEDLETLYGIERECFTIEAFSKEQIAHLLESPNSISLIAKINEEIIGFIIGLIYIQDKQKIGHVFTIDVALGHRRKGIGLKLLKELEKIFKRKRVNACYLEVRRDNRAARELYRKQGYVEMEELKNFYHRGVHGIRLRKVFDNCK